MSYFTLAVALFCSVGWPASQNDQAFRPAKSHLLLRGKVTVSDATLPQADDLTWGPIECVEPAAEKIKRVVGGLDKYQATAT